MSVRIIVDSTADMTEEIRKKVTVIPLTIHFGEEEYIDGVTITGRQFYEKLVESEQLPTTSQVSPFTFQKIFREVVEAGDTAVVMTLASAMSGTCQSAAIAAEDFEGRIFVVDSMNVSIGFGVLAEYAVQLAEQGLSAEEITKELTEKRGKVRILALLDTLEYLKRGGRISKTAAFAGGLLSIKPVICVKDGEITLVGKARGSKQGNNLLIQEIRKAGGVDFDMPLVLGYTGLSDALLVKYMEDSRPLWEQERETLPCTLVGSVVGTHAGPGGVAVAFFQRQAEL